jgi:hypothetical protein
MAGRRCGQGGAGGRGGHHAGDSCATFRAWTASISRCSTTTSARSPSTRRIQGQGDPRALVKKCDVLVENFRAGRARPDGPHVGAHPGAQPADDRRLGQGLRPGTVRGLQGVRERRAMRGRVGLHHGLRRRPAFGDRRADRRLRNGIASRARIVAALYQRNTTGSRPEGAGRDAGRCPQPVPREAARPAAARAHQA